MSDFIKNLQGNKGSQKINKPGVYGSQNYRQEKRRYSGSEKRSGYDRRKTRPKRPQSEELLAKFLTDLSPIIRNFLESVAESQERQIRANELRARAEEEKVNAIENLMVYLKTEGLGALLHQDNGQKKKKKAKKPLDSNRKKIMEIISDRRSKGETFDQIALHLEKENVQTFSGKGQWHAQTIHRLYQDYAMD